MERLSLERFQNPLPLAESILVVWPYLTLQSALTLVYCGPSAVEETAAAFGEIRRPDAEPPEPERGMAKWPPVRACYI